MSADGSTEIVLGILFTIAGVATLILPVPIICCGALIIGPILLVMGLWKAAGGGRPRGQWYAYPPAYAPPYPPPSYPPPTQPAPPAVPGAAAPVPPAGAQAPGGATRTCPKCGRVSVGAKFCPTCGLRFEG